MAVNKIERIGTPRGRDSVDAIEWEQSWRVYLDSPYDGPRTVIAYNGLPKKGDYFQASDSSQPDPNFRCTDRDLKEVTKARGKVFELSCNFSNKYDAAKFESKELKPLDRRPEISWQSRTIQVPHLEDMKTGELLRNSAGDPIGGQTRESYLIAYKVTQNVDSQVDWLIDLLGSLNESPVAIRGRNWDADMLLITEASVTDQLSEMDQLYYKASLTIVANPLTWKAKILDAGFYEYSSGLRKHCMVQGQKATQPCPLNGGEQIPIADLQSDPINTPQWIYSYKQMPRDFTPIGLPPLPL